MLISLNVGAARHIFGQTSDDDSVTFGRPWVAALAVFRSGVRHAFSRLLRGSTSLTSLD